MRTITNDYRDAQILDLGSGYETGPFLVTQNGRCTKRRGAENKDVCPSSGWEVGGLQRVCLQRKTRGDGRTCFSYHGRGNENHQQIERTTSGDGVADRQGGSPGVARSTCGR